MKKQYANPLTTTLVIDTQLQLMAGSVFNETLKTTEVNDGDDFVQGSRQSSNVWDDEFDEDEELD